MRSVQMTQSRSFLPGRRSRLWCNGGSATCGTSSAHKLSTTQARKSCLLSLCPTSVLLRYSSNAFSKAMSIKLKNIFFQYRFDGLSADTWYTLRSLMSTPPMYFNVSSNALRFLLYHASCRSHLHHASCFTGAQH